MHLWQGIGLVDGEEGDKTRIDRLVVTSIRGCVKVLDNECSDLATMNCCEAVCKSL